MTDLPTLLNIFATWMSALNDLWVNINSPIISFFPENMPFLGNVLSTALITLGLSDLSLIEFILGGGLIFYIGYQLLIWVLNLVT